MRGLSEKLPHGDLQPLVSLVLAAIHGSDAVGVPYSASNTVPPYMASVDQGAAMLNNYIEQYAHDCRAARLLFCLIVKALRRR